MTADSLALEGSALLELKRNEPRGLRDQASQLESQSLKVSTQQVRWSLDFDQPNLHLRASEAVGLVGY